MKLLVTMVIGLTFVLLPHLSLAEVAHGVSSVDKFTVALSFNGVVDFVSDGSANPPRAWIVLPDGSDIAAVKLSSTLKGASAPWTIAAHQAMLFGSGLPDSAVACGTDVVTEALKIAGFRVEFEGDLLDSSLSVDRSPLPGRLPCDPADLAKCPDRRPIPVQELSMNWLPKIDRIIPYQLPLRPGLLTDGAGVVASVFPIKAGQVISDGLWKQGNGAFYTVGFDNVPSSVWRKRGSAHGFTVFLRFLGNELTVVRTPLETGDALETVLRPVNGFISLLIENNPVGDIVAGNYLLRDCSGGKNDFALHYILRQESEVLVGPTLSVYNEDGNPLPGPSGNPQCSPADNEWP